MSMSRCLQDYLQQKSIKYNLVKHTHTDTSYNAAKSAHIPVQCMVKGVLLRDDKGYLMAAVAANRSLDLAQIFEQTGRQLRLVEEKELQAILGDCSEGAVPALGEAYGIPTLWDKPLAFQPSFYIEAGDHEELIRLGYYDFMTLMPEANSINLSH